LKQNVEKLLKHDNFFIGQLQFAVFAIFLTRIQRMDLFGLQVKLPPVTTSLITQ